MNQNTFDGITCLYSRVEPDKPRRLYYEFTEAQLHVFLDGIIRECVEIAEENHQNYEKYGEALAGLISVSYTHLTLPTILRV